MILNDKQIQNKIRNKEIRITPTPEFDQYQPCSVDVRLSNEYLQPRNIDLDTKNDTPSYEYMKANRLILPPHSFVLGSTMEKISLPPNIVARVEGRSSIGRLGLTVHVTAGFIDPGFTGNITLEIANLSNNNIVIYEDMRIAQIVFEEIETPNRIYGECGNKYQGQTGVVGSLIKYDGDF